MSCDLNVVLTSNSTTFAFQNESKFILYIHLSTYKYINAQKYL